MTKLNASRRDVLRSTGVGLLGVAGLTTTTLPVASHESIEPSATDLLKTIQVPASSDDGFNYPYYLYVPEASQRAPVPMLVEPNNTGTATDDFEKHRTAAGKLSRGQLGWTRTFAEALTVPLLVPVFPRPMSEPVDANHYVHALDETTMNLDGTELHRVDLQLLNMVEHARELLKEISYPIADDVLLNGFSASGNFVNRFTGLQPNRVRSVTAGGVNGTLLLPIEQAKGHTLNYHIGIADIEGITGETFDADSWRDVPQFIYMGGDDENDTIPYDDAWNEEQRQIALDVYGEDMQEDRMPYCEGVYDDAGAAAEFKIYEGVGHKIPNEIQEDIVGFHRREAELKNVSFTEPPAASETTAAVHAALFDDTAVFDLRIRSDDRGDLTETTATVSTGESVDATIDLSTAIESGESISVLAVPSGETDPATAVASVTQQATDPPSLQVVEQPRIHEPTFTIKYAIGADYEAESQLHLYLQPTGGGPKQLLDTISPGTIAENTYELNPAELDVSIEVGSELQAQLVDIDRSEQLATDLVVVEDDDQSEQDSLASVTFEAQPTEGHDEIALSYEVDNSYQPATFLTLQLEVGDDTNVLLDSLAPGATATEAVSLEKIPLNAGDTIEAAVVDQRSLATAKTVVVGDTNDAVSVQFTDQPTDSDPTATVQYQIADAYQLRDVLTLRAYADTLPGTAPGEALKLLDVGDEGAETFIVGEDVEEASDELIAAIMDDVPLALATATDAPGGFEVLEPTASAFEIAVGQTESFDVDVRVTNTGANTSSETILVLAAGQEIAQQDCQLAAGAEQELTFGSFNPSELGLDPGVHPVTIETNSDQVSGEITVYNGGLEILEPSAEFTRSVERTGELELSVSVSNPETDPSAGTVQFVIDDQAVEQQEVQLEAAEESDITFGPYVPSELGLERGPHTAQVTTGNSTVNGAVTVSLGAVVGETPPQDLNNDGLYEDITGDGAVTIADVQALVEHRTEPVIQANAGLFNFDGSDASEVTLADVQALFTDYLDES